MNKSAKGQIIFLCLFVMLAGIGIAIYTGYQYSFKFKEPVDFYEANWNRYDVEKQRIVGEINTRDIGVLSSAGKSGGTYAYMIPVYATDEQGNEYVYKFVGVQVSRSDSYDMDKVFSTHEIVTATSPRYSVDGTVSLMNDDVREMFLNRLTVNYGLSYSDANAMLAPYVVVDTPYFLLLISTIIAGALAIAGLIGLVATARSKG